MNKFKMPEVYEYQDGAYDDPSYFDNELAEDGSCWCRAFDVVVMYQEMKERIEYMEGILKKNSICSNCDFPQFGSECGCGDFEND